MVSQNERTLFTLKLEICRVYSLLLHIADLVVSSRTHISQPYASRIPCSSTSQISHTSQTSHTSHTSHLAAKKLLFFEGVFYYPENFKTLKNSKSLKNISKLRNGAWVGTGSKLLTFTITIVSGLENYICNCYSLCFFRKG